MMTPIKLYFFFYLHLSVISPGSNNALMFTRLVLTNTDLLHLVTSTSVREHSRNWKYPGEMIFSPFSYFLFFRILPPKTMPGTHLTPVSGKWSRQKATGDTEFKLNLQTQKRGANMTSMWNVNSEMRWREKFLWSLVVFYHFYLLGEENM